MLPRSLTHDPQTSHIFPRQEQQYSVSSIFHMAEIDKVYGPLDEAKRQFRLMRMEHDEDSQIKCHLGIFSLDTEMVYVALSYCWTEKEPTCEILLNGRPFQVRPNLFDYLSLMSEERQNCQVFTDALCINQENEAEISSQISIMGHIYEHAQEVVACMGDAGDFDSSLNHLFSQLEQVYRNEDEIVAPATGVN